MRSIIVIFSLSFGLSAQGLSLPEYLSASFTQMITNPQKKVIHYTGTVQFMQPSLSKWIYTTPTQKEVCLNNHELKVVDHDLEQVSQYRINKGLKLAKILKYAKLHKKDIYVAHYEDKSYTIKIDAQRRLQSIAYFDELENKVQIIFKKVKYKKGKFDKAKMTCKIPKDYDIIRG